MKIGMLGTYLQGIATLPEKNLFHKTRMFFVPVTSQLPCMVTSGYSHVGNDLVPFIQHSIFANYFTTQTLISV